jgi:hypothetical protein
MDVVVQAERHAFGMTKPQGYNDLNRKHRRALGTLVSRMFELFGKKVPGAIPSRSPPRSSRSAAAWR